METRSFFINFIVKGLIVVFVCFGFNSLILSSSRRNIVSGLEKGKDAAGLLKEVYQEVKGFGKHENEDFFKRDFHVDLDQDEKNSEEYVVVLIHDTLDGEKMIVQVTTFEAKGPQWTIKYAKDTKEIVSFIKKDKIEISKSDYSEKDMKRLLPDILQIIRDKKALLKLIDRKNSLN
jgi:hypothetical protein